MIVAHHNRRRRDLLQLRLRDISLRSLELVAITATAAAAGLGLGGLHHRDIQCGCDQCHLFLGLLDDFLAEIVRAHKNRRDDDDVCHQ